LTQKNDSDIIYHHFKFKKFIQNQ